MEAYRYFLVRHAEAENDMLTSDGERQAFHACEELARQGVAEPMIMTSDRGRAVATAEVISRQFDYPFVIRHESIADAGLIPEKVRRLEDVVAACLDFAQVEVADGTDFVIVTHAPLVARAAG